MKTSSQAARPWLAATLFLSWICGCVSCPAFSSNSNNDPNTNEANDVSATAQPAAPIHVYRAMIPLGSEVFAYKTKQEHEIFYVMASAQDREFAGEQVCLDGNKRVLKTPNGLPVRNYPHEVRFRVSVSQRDSYLLLDPPLEVDSHANNFSEFITSLTFEMKIFHALKARILHPTKVTHIGIPPDVPSDERIYEVTFDIGEVPISDRIVMHVLTAQGERLAKFNVDLY